jgi:hypothetical protein
MEEELPKPADIEIELNDIYRHDEEQAFITLMSQEVKSLNFAAEANYTVRLCKEIVAYHYPDKMPLGSFELVASNKVRSDEETLGEVFNGDPYACDPPKEPADDPCFDWVPRKEQIFDEHKLMQLSIWKKEWDEDNKCYEPVDLGYMAYGYEQTRKWRKMGYLNEKGLLKEESQLINEGLITDETQIADYHKKVETIKVLREQYCVREKHAKEVANEIKIKDDVNEAIEWLRFHKEKDWGIAEKLKAKRDAGEKDEVQEESDVEDGVEIYVCEPTRLW